MGFLDVIEHSVVRQHSGRVALSFFLSLGICKRAGPEYAAMRKYVNVHVHVRYSVDALQTPLLRLAFSLSYVEHTLSSIVRSSLASLDI